MNFNHLMEAKYLRRKCASAGRGECYWIPVGNIRSTHGDNVHMTMYCKHCGLPRRYISQQTRLRNTRKNDFKGDS